MTKTQLNSEEKEFLTQVCWAAFTNFEEIIAELKKVLSKMRTNFLEDEHLVSK